MVLKFKLNNKEDGAVITGGENVRDTLVVPKKLQHKGEEYPVIAIEDNAFGECKDLTSVIIPNTVTKIGDYAFWACTGLTSIVIPDSVTEIGEYTFEGCKSLANINIPDSVTEIGCGAFCDCDSLPDDVEQKIMDINGFALNKLP